MEDEKVPENHLSSAAAFVEGGIQEACDDACSICLEDFSDSDPSTVTTCKHEFHLQCILEWCQRSSQCPMCWQTISLKDPNCQELLDAVEHERNLRMNPPRNTTIFHHPTLGDFELQHLPVSASDSELEERIIQHLAAAAAMGRTRQLGRREGHRSRSSTQGRPHFLVFSTNPNSSSASSSPAHRGGVGTPPTVMIAGPNSPFITVEENSPQITSQPSAAQAYPVTTSSSGSSAVAVQLGISSSNQRSPAQTSPSSQDVAGPSDLHLFPISEFMEARRSGNYEQNIWDDDYVQSLTSPYVGKEYLELAENLKEKMRVIINEVEDELDRLELIDNLQRLDVSYHFQDEIKKLLEHTYLNSTGHNNENEKNLYSTALKFRLLRQHGYQVPQEVFCSFMDEGGNFRAELSGDIEGVLSMYEASFLSMENEGILGEARNFATRHLKEKLQHITDQGLAAEVSHALELPLHWRVQKLEAKWFIDAYENRPDANLILLELAKLDFNIVQAIYQDEVKQMSRWYKETCLPEKLSFARDRLVECFFWALGFTPEPQFGYCRKVLTKTAVMITIIDDIYDVYGRIDELELFTDIVERWDINALNQLPEYMRMCFLTLFNSTNEMAYNVLKDQGLNVISNARKLWAELCRHGLMEARWYNSGYFPSLSEYLNMAWISISGPVLLFNAYFCTISPLTKKDLGSLEQYPGIIHWPSLVLRLADDLGTSSDEIKRGDIPKSIECYMKDTGCSEEEARDYIKYLIDVTSKKMNKEILMESPYKDFVGTAMNLARICQCIYQYGDGFGVPHLETKKNIISLIVEPIPLQL